MNALIILVAILALMRAALFFFDRSEDIYGLVVIGVTLLMIAWFVEEVLVVISGYRAKRRQRQQWGGGRRW